MNWVMTQQEILYFLKNNKPFFEKNFGLKSIGLFGSYAKDNFNHESDIDILIELQEQKYDYWFAIKKFLETSLNKKVDVITTGSHLKKQFLDSINTHLIYV
jgi:predicted nucleotidyltransferase